MGQVLDKFFLESCDPEANGREAIKLPETSRTFHDPPDRSIVALFTKNVDLNLVLRTT